MQALCVTAILAEDDGFGDEGLDVGEGGFEWCACGVEHEIKVVVPWLADDGAGLEFRQIDA